MKDPTRWLNSPEQAPPGVADLLRVAPRPSRPAPEVRARLGAELEVLAASAPPRAPFWPFAAGAAVVAVGLAGWLVLSRARPVAPPSPPVPTPAARAELPPLAFPAEAPPSAAPEPTAERAVAGPVRAPSGHRLPSHVSAPRGEPRGAAPSTDAPADSLAREAALVEEARRTVHARPAAALRTLDRHRSEFPAGQLTAEREFLTVSALVQLGRRAEAEARGRRLMAEYPGSAYAQRVPGLLERGPRPAVPGQ